MKPKNLAGAVSLGMTLKVIVFASVLFGVAYIAYLATLSYSGYCFSERRYLSDQERIERAVTFVLASMTPPVARYDISPVDKRRKTFQEGTRDYVPYRSVHEFFELNPNCCVVVDRFTYRGGETYIPNFWNRLTGAVSAVISMKYQVRYRDKDGAVHVEYAEAAPAISSCGHVWSGI